MDTVLIVDDDHEMRVLLRRYLEEHGYEVVSTGDGQVGIDVLNSGQCLPRWIILDLVMPVMDGHEFLRKIRSIERLREIPVLVVSAHSPGDISLAQGFMAKPFDLKKIVEFIQNH